MIGHLRGKLLFKSPPLLLIDVQGIGYEVEAPMSTFYQIADIGEEIILYTHLVIRDDAHLLFGFASENERSLFRHLLKVNGVGAKMALTILSGIETDDFIACINEGDSARLTRLPGVGKKTAERLIIEMRDRLDSIPVTSMAPGTPPRQIEADSQLEDAISALIALGYKPQEASRYVHAVVSKGMDSEEIIRQALKASVSK